MTLSLEEARKKAGYSIADVAKKLKIRKQYILCLEKDDFDSLPGDVYIQGYKQIYYKFLGIDLPKKKPISVLPPVAIYETNSINKGYIVFFAACMLGLVVLAYSMLNKSPLDEEEVVDENAISVHNIAMPK
ncbi:MAG: hypothetical protein COA94_06145 [Rickettsiales bacterium]|nr:MAG: hypothetical protein COA94_06145 [Rickettsiales bacterium]